MHREREKEKQGHILQDGHNRLARLSRTVVLWRWPQESVVGSHDRTAKEIAYALCLVDIREASGETNA